ncbi:MAG: YceI family protein [Opitutales bacterium]|nr:YceI family protein [Opitutales bacterium]
MKAHARLSTGELAASLESSPRPVLLDVRPATEHARRRLPGARNNCVYEIQFPERMAETVPDKAAPVCVYGDSARTREAAMAAEKLDRMGYEAVFELAGGVEAWDAEGFPLEGSSEPAPPAPPAELNGRRDIDLAESRVEWTGRNLLNRHRGTLALKSGKLDFENGVPVSGRFNLDMHALACENLKGDPLHDVLIEHLRSHDFFDTGVYPTAEIHLRSVTPIAGATPGAPNLRCLGELTLKDRTHPLEFDAATGLTPEGRFAAQANLAFDRTRWGVLYGSGKFFRNLGMHLVNDLVEISVRLLTR